MTPEQGRLETQYIITRCLLKFLQQQNLISENQYQEHLKASAETHHSMIGELEMTSYAGKEDHPN